MLRKSLVLAAFIVSAPVVAFAATGAPVVKSPATTTSTDKTTPTAPTAHKTKHHVILKKQKVSAEPDNMVKTPATKP
jgi:hypothetical protein